MSNVEAIPASNTVLAASHPLSDLVRPRRFGRLGGSPGVTLSVRQGYGLASLTARRGQAAVLAQAFAATMPCTLPGPGKRHSASDLSVVWTGHEQWWVIWDRPPDRGAEVALSAVSGLAACVDQTDGRCLIQVSGPHARDALCKGIAVDLHPSVFTSSDTCASLAGHIGIHLWQRSDDPVFEIAVSRSYARSLWAWLESSSAEYGGHVAV
ncbi:MAG: sarcosine oxidase subunit gamma [Hyphomicrobiaceae bacterium]|nr:sarcosine oxidase subunit gamma [Hyphomicrobiaceae bacterium]